MLSALKIRNLALVDEVNWELAPGLVCVTGETGAGKSIIVGALKLVLGERADRSLIRNGETSCTVEAVFRLPKPDPINRALEAAGLDPCEDSELIIRRIISATGHNKQFINCSPATIAVLKSLGHHLVDLHGPHDHQSLLSQERQLAMLDAYAGTDTNLATYRAAYGQWRALSAEFEALTQSERATEQEIDLLRYQIGEIDDAAPQAGEEESLEQRYKMASNGTRLGELAGQVTTALNGESDSVLARLGDVQRLLRELEKIDRGTADLTSGFESAFVEIEELESGLRDYLDRLEVDPAQVAELENRINTLETLKRKYGNTLEDVLAHREDAATKLGRIEGRGDEIQRLEGDVAAAWAKVEQLGVVLGQKRKKAAPRLAKEISAHLEELGFKRAKFEAKLAALDQPAYLGLEQVDFLFAPNPGEPSKPLRIIASSGEMSRVMLAIKSALAKEDAIPLLVFDEIDANVGGGIAEAVGAKMASLGGSHQVISITHLPQVAALAASHYVVNKEIDEKEDRTRSVLKAVEGKKRVAEIARMLGGKKASARAHAESLLAGV